MKRIVYIMAAVLLAVTTSCEHKDLCYNHPDHAHKYHINVIADYRYDWEETYDGTDWEAEWPEGYFPYDDLRPEKPEGLRVVNYSDESGSNTHNLSPDGGEVTLYEGLNDILFYNNDTEYILFSRIDNENGATTRATTRSRSRSTYQVSEYAEEGEETMTPPDMLFANYFEDYLPEKVQEAVDVEVTLQPLVFTYKVRYEFAEGLKYVSLARGALTGMARSVIMNSGETSEESATILYDCEVTDYGVRAFVTSFGIPAFPNENYPARSSVKHALNLEVMLRNGNMMTFDFDVTDQVESQPHGGVIIVKDIVIKQEEGTQASGGFDVSVGDWGPYQDIDLPL